MNEGTVLISVLWVILLLSLVSFSLASTVRMEVASAQQSFDSERALFMAKGAAEIVYNSFAKNLPIPENSPIKQEKGEYIVTFNSGEARVRFDSQAGLININSASDKLLAALFDSLGVQQETRNRLVDSILDWQDEDDIPHLYGAEVADYPQDKSGKRSLPRNGPFQSVDELLLVKNMTQEIFYGSFSVDPVSGKYRRTPGVRDLVTIASGTGKIDPNLATQEVLQALPGTSADLVARIVAERSEKRFANDSDLLQRIPELNQSGMRDYVGIEERQPAELVSRATISNSGISRTVRLLFKTEEKLKIITYAPLIYKRVMESRIDRWRFQ